jgi:hypothetical protein
MKRKSKLKAAIAAADPKQPSLELKSDHPKPELPRLAYTLAEFAGMVGISYISAYRLFCRGKIKRCGTLRTILIPKSEVDRFLEGRAAA